MTSKSKTAKTKPGKNAAHKAGVALEHRANGKAPVGKKGAHNAAVTLDHRK